MRRWLSVLAGVTLGCAVSAAPAMADVSSVFFAFPTPPGARHVTSTTIPLRSSGLLTVDFHSDPASGCARLGACGYHGTQILKPFGAQLTVQRYTLTGRRHTRVYIVFNAVQPTGQSAMFARVVRDGAGTCVDASGSGFGAALGRVSAGRYAFALAGALASTRCAGPLPVDIRAALPTLRVSASPSPGTRLDARRVATFAAHGFAGTVTSTLVFTAGHASSQGGSEGPPPPPTKVRRIRVLIEDLNVVAASGSLVADVRGTAVGDVCVLLDSCGLTGTLTFTPQPGASQGELAVAGPAGLPYRAFLVALGLRPGTPRRGLHPDGNAFWADRGKLRADLSQSARCTDHVKLTGEAISLAVGAARVRAALEGFSGVRTRCPGPQFAGTQTFASGSAARSVLRHRRFDVTLKGTGSFTDDGYVVRLRGAVTLTFQTGRVTSQIQEEPVG